jgi:hypothetical protein
MSDSKQGYRSFHDPIAHRKDRGDGRIDQQAGPCTFNVLWAGVWGGAALSLGSKILLRVEDMVGPNGLEPSTSSVSRKRSNQLSYGPRDTGWRHSF